MSLVHLDITGTAIDVLKPLRGFPLQTLIARDIDTDDFSLVMEIPTLVDLTR